ncbi:MAG: glycosyltransferase family 39 protein [Desulfatibacillaceae bacterium]|nr:glycosyltransferase family 39 protein [Desulfatibacillaceae bacterium]
MNTRPEMDDVSRFVSPASQIRHNSVWIFALVAVLLLVHAGLAFSSILTKSDSCDENAHILAGYTYWKFNDFRLQPENGNLPQRIVSLPLLFLSLNLPDENSSLWQESDVWRLSHQFFFKEGNNFRLMLFAARGMVILASILLGIVVFAWSKSLFGAAGGLISLTLYAFSPTMLAHARLSTSDMIVTLFFLLCTGALWRLACRINPKTLLLAGAAGAGLVLSKMSGVLIAPIWLVLMVFAAWRKKPIEIKLPKLEMTVNIRAGRFGALILASLIWVAIAWVLIWSFYGFRYSAFAHPAPEQSNFLKPWENELALIETAAPIIGWAQENRILPEAYLYGLTYTLAHSKFREAFLAGNYSMTGWWYFFPFSFLVKTPLSLLLLLVLAAWLLYSKSPPEKGRIFPLLAFFAVYWLFSITSNLNIGHRHILPIYPVVFILCGSCSIWLARKNLLQKLVVAVLVCTFALESILVAPHFLSFFNRAAGGPENGYRLLVDSSLDWGQDLPSLKKWLDEQGLQNQDHTPVYLSYFGSSSPIHYGVQYWQLLGYPVFSAWDSNLEIPAPFELVPGIYCISATLLQQLYVRFPGRWCQRYELWYQTFGPIAEKYYSSDMDDSRQYNLLVEKAGGIQRLEYILSGYQWLRFGRLCQQLRQREPDAYAGYSILIYRVEQEELDMALKGAPAQLHPDSGIKDREQFMNAMRLKQSQPLSR